MPQVLNHSLLILMWLPRVNKRHCLGESYGGKRTWKIQVLPSDIKMFCWLHNLISGILNQRARSANCRITLVLHIFTVQVVTVRIIYSKKISYIEAYISSMPPFCSYKSNPSICMQSGTTSKRLSSRSRKFLKLSGSSVANAVVYDHQIALTWILNSWNRSR